MTSFFRKLSWMFKRRDRESDLREELQFHLDEEAEIRQGTGVAAEEARWAARREMGNLALVQENTRSAWGWTMIEQFAQDLRYAFRTMANSKGFTALAILSLALGIGANVAIFSFMDTLLLRSLPVADPQTLAVINWRWPSSSRESVMHGMSGRTYADSSGTGSEGGIFPFPAFELIRKSSDAVFSTVFAYYPTRKVNLMVKGQAEQASGEFVSGDYFSGLAIQSAAGRAIYPDDDRAGAPIIAVLSYPYSQKRFGDPASAVGQPIFINNVPVMVVGVAPPGFFGVNPAEIPDFFIPIFADLQLKLRGGPEDAKGYLDANYYWIEMMGRLRPGVNLTQANAALGPVFHQWVANTAANDKERAFLPNLWIREGAGGLDTLRRTYSKPIYVLLTMVVLILAIACANIANLLLARAMARRREMAVRLSMGAGRLRVIRQLLTESLLLASIGGAIGVLFAIWGVRFLMVLLAGGNNPFPVRPDLNWHMLTGAVALAMITGIVFGLAPAFQATKVDVIPALKETRAGQHRGQGRFRRAGMSQILIVGQIGLSLLMLVAAGLFIRTLENLQSIQLGFNRESVLLFQINARQAGHKDPEIDAFYGEMQKRFAAIPGVRSASVSQSPLLGEGTWASGIAPVGKEPKGRTDVLTTGSDFFATMQIPIVAGRPITEGDRLGSALVAVVNEAYVKTNFGDQNPFGQHLIVKRRGVANAEVEIVGVAKNARYGDLKGEFNAIVYLPFLQDTYYPVEEMTYALRTSTDPLRFASTVREIVRQADTRIPVTNIETEAAQVDHVMSQEIMFAELCSAMAILALVIACVGLYGTVSYNVARRTGEIGIRTALGAQRGRLVWMIQRDVIVLAAIGLALSVPTALATSKFVGSFLYGLKPNDPIALTIAATILVAAALLAGYLPARKASRIDPMIALRHE